MTSEQVERLIQRLVAEFRYKPEIGNTIGVPWSEKEVNHHVDLLKQALVKPYRQRFNLSETYDQVASQAEGTAEYWVVAKRSGYLLWYDPRTDEFGLGELSDKSELPVSIGVRGDLVGVFCAM